MSAAFSRAYERKIKAAERRNFKQANAIYIDGFEKATELMLSTGNINNVELMPAQTLFNIEMFDDLFRDIYVNTGLEFALWYQRNFERLSKKSEGFIDIWTNSFTVMGAGQRVKKLELFKGRQRKHL